MRMALRVVAILLACSGSIGLVPTPGASARGQDLPQHVLTAQQVLGEVQVPRSIQAVVSSGGGGYTDFVREALARKLTDPAFAARAGTPRNLQAAPREVIAATVSQLTETQVKDAILERVGELSGTRPPANLPALARAQNRRALQQAPGVRSVAAANPPSTSLAAFNWTMPGYITQKQGIVTAVQNQGGCGCCWAFGTVAAYESAFIKATAEGPIKGSEQYILNNFRLNPKAQALGLPFSCNGGWWAFDQIIGPGLASGATVPYQGGVGQPNPNVPLPYRAVSWGYVTDMSQMPTNAELKQALVDRGPLAVAVYASTQAFGVHDGKNPIADFPSDPNNGSQVDHAVLLVGWDDHKGPNGAWLIKNSWGTGWGDRGFGWVAYNHNNLGWGAAWVAPSDTIVKPIVAAGVEDAAPRSPTPGAAPGTVVPLGDQVPPPPEPAASDEGKPDEATPPR